MRKLAACLGTIVLGAAGCGPESYEQETLQPGTMASALGAAPPDEVTSERYIVSFRDGARGMRALEQLGAEVLLELGPQNAAAVRIPSVALRSLREDPSIALIEPDPLRRPLAQSTPYGISMVQADQVWPDASGARRKVCIIDSGLYTRHEDLQSRGLSGSAPDWNTDGCGHGTHVAGTIAALHNRKGVVGVVPSGRLGLHIEKVFNDSCQWSFASTLVDALNRCVAAGANVVNMSLGGYFPSQVEAQAFNEAFNDKNVLSVAAAGNDGSDWPNYPASYPDVISVGAVDANKVVADFSQRNAQVSLTAPGVGVESTVGYVERNELEVGNTLYRGRWVENAARDPWARGQLVNGGFCDSVGDWKQKIVVCSRGNITFFEKVSNVQAGGGVAAVLYNNVPGPLFATLGAGNSSDIPAISLSQDDGLRLVYEDLGLRGVVTSTLREPASGYDTRNGTSMSAPHVSGVAALIWSVNPKWTNAQIRHALEATAEDLGTEGKDDEYGYGLVQAKDALDYLLNEGTIVAEPILPLR